MPDNFYKTSKMSERTLSSHVNMEKYMDKLTAHIVVSGVAKIGPFH